MPKSQSSVPNVDTEQSINGVPMPPTFPGPTRVSTAAMAAYTATTIKLTIRSYI